MELSANMTEKEVLRAEAIRQRNLMSIKSGDAEALRDLFFEKVEIPEGAIVAAYWPKDREMDVKPIIEELLNKNITCALPVIQNGSRILRFAPCTDDMKLVEGLYGVLHPITDEHTNWLAPDIFMVPLLAFDRRGHRLGFGGGYYDATLSYYKAEKNSLAVGMAYAQQACLFNLPTKPHDIKMDWVITPQGATDFRD